MTETIRVELTPQQRELLLDGLSYLRNCALLEMHYPSEKVEEERERQVREIEDLVEQLGGSRPANTHASV